MPASSGPMVRSAAGGSCGHTPEYAYQAQHDHRTFVRAVGGERIIATVEFLAERASAMVNISDKYLR